MKIKGCSIADAATVMIRITGSNREILRCAEAQMMAEVGTADFRDVKNTDIIQGLLIDGHKARKGKK